MILFILIINSYGEVYTKVQNNLCLVGIVLFYPKGINNGIIKTKNLLYAELAKTELERQQRYQNCVLEERPYEDIVDKVFKTR